MLVVLAVVALIGGDCGRGGARWSVAALAVVVPAAYLPFWGPHAISEVWNGAAYFGPFYYLPALIPLVAFGAAAMVALARRTREPAPRWVRPLTAVVLVAMTALTGWSVPEKVSANLAVRADFQALQQFLTAQRMGRAVLLLPSRGDPSFDSSSPFLINDPQLQQPVVYAESRGGQDLELLDRFTQRAIYRLNQQLPPGRTTGGQLSMDLLHAESGPVITIHLHLTNPTARPTALAYLDSGAGPERTRTLDDASTRGESYDIIWTVVAPAAAAPTASEVVRIPASSSNGVLAVGLDMRRKGDAAIGDRYEQRIAYRVLTAGRQLQMLRPGQSWSRDDGPTATWNIEVSNKSVTELR